MPNKLRFHPVYRSTGLYSGRNCTSTLLFAVLFINIYAALYFAIRKLLLRETGRKLVHVEKQLRTRQSSSGELTERLREDSL